MSYSESHIYQLCIEMELGKFWGRAAYGTVSRQMAHDRGNSSQRFILHCDGVQRLMERASYGTVSKIMAHDGGNTSQRFILHCGGVEKVREDVSFSTHSYQAAKKAFLSSYFTRVFTLVISSLCHQPSLLQSNQDCCTV